MAKILSKTKENMIKTLQQRRIRQRLGLFVVEGVKMVTEICENSNVDAVVSTERWLRENKWLHDAVPEDKLYACTEEQMTRMSSFAKPSPLLAVLRGHCNEVDARDIKIDDGKLYLVLDEIQDPGNLGTILRTAEWFGIYEVFLSRGCAEIYNPKVIQSTMGTLMRIETKYCDIAELLRIHKEMTVYGTLLDGESIYEADLSANGFIIMGNEGHGISSEMRELIAVGLCIPAYGKGTHPESLNVSVSTGIVLSEFRKKHTR